MAGIIEQLREDVNSISDRLETVESHIAAIATSLDNYAILLNAIKTRLEKLEEPAPAPVPVPEPTPTPTPTPVPVPTPVPTGFKTGINLKEPKTWVRERIFTNAMMNSSAWRKCLASSPSYPFTPSPLGTYPAFDAKGYPLDKLPMADGTTLRLDLFCDNGEKYPLGTYKVSFEGDATVQVRSGLGTGVVLAELTGAGEFTVTSTAKPGLQVAILKNDPANPLKNLKITLPGLTTVLEPKFASFMKPFSIVRFMDQMRTNNSTVTDTCVMDYVIPHEKNGTPINKIIEMCTTLLVQPWFCLPHLSTDSYNQKMAAALKASSIPVIYLEFSNELWNSQFQQCNWLYTTAKAKGIDGALFWAQEAHRRFKIWADVFGSERGRLKFVVAGQNANVWHAKTVAAHMTAMGIKPDVISSALYFSKPGNITTAQMAAKTVNEVGDIALNDLRTETMPRAKTHIDLAASIGAEFIAYECGQHFTVLDGEEYPQVYRDVQTHPKMGQAYYELRFGCEHLGGDGLVWFNSCQVPAASGCWGLVNDTDQDPMTSVKYQAVFAGSL